MFSQPLGPPDAKLPPDPGKEMLSPTAFEATARSIVMSGIFLLVAPTSAARAQDGVAPDDVDIRFVIEMEEPCLNVRERPSYRAPILECVDQGTRLEVRRVQRGWSLVQHESGVRGWVGSRFLGATPSAAVSSNAATVGEQASPAPIPEPPPAEPEIEVEEPGEQEADPVTYEPAPVEIQVPPTAEGTATDPAPPTDESGNEAPMSVALDEFLRVSGERDAATEQLAQALLRVEELEAQLNGLGDVTRRAGELSSRVDELGTERDSLARQLARAEAQQLYLLSDLEETRGELMRLKGIPAKLVEPEAPPEPEPPALLEEPEPVIEAAEPEPEPEIAALPDFLSAASIDDVVATVQAWANAWSGQRADDYLAFYGPSFVPPEGLSRELWEARRRVRLEAPSSIDVRIEQINPMVIGERATVTFVQSYDSDSFQDVVDKTLVLERSGDLWQIVEEHSR